MPAWGDGAIGTETPCGRSGQSLRASAVLIVGNDGGDQEESLPRNALIKAFVIPDLIRDLITETWVGGPMT